MKEPDIEAIERIARRELDVPDETFCVITFLAEGAFNKVYRVQCRSNAHYITRIPVPVQPRLKTLGEVATIGYVRQNTKIPVPNVLKFDFSHNNELGFEWTLMN